jgi:hypothetical protein
VALSRKQKRSLFGPDTRRDAERKYIPPLRFRALTRFYDPLARRSALREIAKRWPGVRFEPFSIRLP